MFTLDEAVERDDEGPLLSPIVELIVLATATALAVRWLEPRMAFFPTRGETATPRDFGVDYEPFDVATKDGERLHGWTLHPASRPLARIVYFHGNGGNLSVWAPILAGIAQRGYEVVAFDYRGYGSSTGRPTERGLYRDVDAIVSYTCGDVYWGRSLGVCMAAYAATIQPPRALILESGFRDVRALLARSPVLLILSLFSAYRFSAGAHLARTRVPALVIHGDADTVIPFRLGRQLFERLAGPKAFVTIRGGDHNDVAPPDPDAYWSAVVRFISSLPAAESPLARRRPPDLGPGVRPGVAAERDPETR